MVKMKKRILNSDTPYSKMKETLISYRLPFFPNPQAIEVLLNHHHLVKDKFYSSVHYFLFPYFLFQSSALKTSTTLRTFRILSYEGVVQYPPPVSSRINPVAKGISSLKKAWRDSFISPYCFPWLVNTPVSPQ